MDSLNRSGRTRRGSLAVRRQHRRQLWCMLPKLLPKAIWIGEFVGGFVLPFVFAFLAWVISVLCLTSPASR